MHPAVLLSLVAQSVSSFHAPRPPARRGAPVPFARFARSRIQMSTTYKAEWVSVEAEMAARVMDRYFGAAVAAGQTAELFVIEGVPAASMLCTVGAARQAPVVDSFHLNRGLLCLFDAGAVMRSELRSRHAHLDVDGATNLEIFLAV